MEAKLETFEVLDSRDEIYIIKADSWEVSSNGLTFSINKEIVAWFLNWKHWIKA